MGCAMKRSTSPLAYYVTRRETKPYLKLVDADLAALACHLPGKRCVIRFGTWRRRAAHLKGARHA